MAGGWAGQHLLAVPAAAAVVVVTGPEVSFGPPPSDELPGDWAPALTSSVATCCRSRGPAAGAPDEQWPFVRLAFFPGGTSAQYDALAQLLAAAPARRGPAAVRRRSCSGRLAGRPGLDQPAGLDAFNAVHLLRRCARWGRTASPSRRADGTSKR
jgi:hypothetical protein